MRRLLLWLVILLLLGAPRLGWSQAQLINGSRVVAGWINYGLTTGTGAAYVLTLTPALPGYVDGACFLFRAHAANTGDATLNVNGRGATPLRKWSGGSAVPLVVGDIAAQQMVEACYDSTNGPRMQVQSLGGGTTSSGITTMPTAGDQVLISDSTTTGTWQTLPNCPDSGGNHLNYNLATNQWVCGTSGGTVGSVAFSAITGGTNTAAAMLVGTGASLAPTGSGTITATGLNSPLVVTSGGTGAAPSTGDQVLISDTPSTATWRTLPNCPDAAGNHLNYDLTTNLWSCGTSSGASAGHTIQDETTPLTARTNLRFQGAGVTCADNAGANATDCTIPGGGSGNVTNTGTPVDNQVAVWTTATQIEGTSALTYNAGTLGIGAVGTLGKVTVAGNISGVVTVQPPANFTSYNFNLPTTAGTAGQVLTSGGGGGAPMTWAAGTGHTIQDEGSVLTTRTGLNFTGAGIACADDSANNRTTCAVSGAGSGAGIFGTPATGQMAIWHDATSIEGASSLTITYTAVHVATAGTPTAGVEFVTTGSGGVTRTLPAAASPTSTRQFRILKEDAGAGALTIAPFAGNTINGGTASLSTSTQWAGFVIHEVSGTGWAATPLFPTGAGLGDFSTGTNTSVDGELMLFSGTTGKLGKRAVTSGVLKGTNGVLSASLPGTDHTTPTGAEDLLNKRIGPRVAQLSAASGTVTAPDASVTGADIYYRSDISGALTIPAPSGTPMNGQRLLLRLKPASTVQTLTLTGGAGGFCGVAGMALPTITGDSSTYVEYNFTYNAQVTPNACWVFDGTTKSTAPLSLADGGTGTALVDPNANRALVWDNTDKATRFATIGSGLTYTPGTDTLTAPGGTRYINMECIPDATAISTTAKCYAPIHADWNGWSITNVTGYLGNAVSTSGPVTVSMDVCAALATGARCSGTTRALFTTNMTIDQNENRSATGTAPVISAANAVLAAGEYVRVNVVAQGTGAQGLYIIATITQP